MGLPVTKKEEARMLQLSKEGLTPAIISRRLGRPAKTVSRVLKKLAAAKQTTS